MRPSSIRLGTVVFLCASALLLAPIAADDSPPADVQRIEQEVRDLEYRLSWQEAPQLREVDSAWHAPNRAQGIRSYFTGDGLRVVPRLERQDADWQVGLTLIGYGRDASVGRVEPAKLSADGKRIDYHRGQVGEWYVNDAIGLEQGFDLLAPPRARTQPDRFVPGARRTKTDGEAFLVLTIEGSLSPRVAADGQSIEFATISGGVSILHYGHLEVRDAKGQLLPSWLEGFAEAGIRGVRIVFDDADAVYPVMVDPLLTSAAWSAEPDQEGARFGISVAGAGDVNHDGWDDVIVGAYTYDNGGYADAGRVFVYYGSASGLSLTADWTATADSAEAGFGFPVRAAGDLDGDGRDDVIVGATLYDNTVGGTNAGAVFVYYGPLQDMPCGETGMGEPICLPGDADWAVEGDVADARFGTAADAAGDVGGGAAGFGDLIVGGVDSNAVSVFYGPLQDMPCGDVGDGELLCLPGDADWTATGSHAGSRFGIAVAGAGNVNGDSFDDVIIGSVLFANGQVEEGSAYVFTGPLQNMTCSPACSAADAPWMAEGGQIYAHFGGSVASAGDVNGDGFDDVIVGAPHHDGVAGWDSGQVRVYHGSVLGPSTSPDWIGQAEAANVNYGTSVADAGDVNFDGYDDVIIGAHLYDGGGTNEGRAYVFEGSPTGLAPGKAWSWTAEGNQFSAQFGQSVAGAGDVNGDGYDDVVVGAPYHSHGQENEGRATVYHGAPKVTGWTLANHLGLQPLQIREASWSVQPADAAEPLPITATPEAISYGPVPQSVLLTTGRVIDAELAATYPETRTGIEDVDWGADGEPDRVRFELDLDVPPWAETIRFTTQFVTNEIGERYGGHSFDTDSARFEFYLNGWSRETYALDDPARWVVNSPVSHVIKVSDGSRVKLVFMVEDVDGSEDTGLVLSRVFFSTLPFPQDITLEHDGVDGNGDGVVDYFNNPAPHDVSLASGTYSFSRDLFAIPGLSMPFRLAVVYNSQSDRRGGLGRKWTHSYQSYTEKIMTDEDGNGTAETLSAILVRHGAGTAEYFEPDGAGGFRPKYSGSYSTLTESPGTFTLVDRSHVTHEFAEPGETDDVRLLTRVTDPNGVSFSLAYADQAGSKEIDHITDTRGEQIDFLYSGDRLTSVEYMWETADEPPQSTVSEVRFEYDLGTADLSSITDLNGYATTFAYDRVGNLLEVTDADGVMAVSNTYEQYQGIDLLQVGDRVLTQRNSTDPDPYDPAAGVSFEYDGESLCQTDRLDHQDTRLFDVRGRMARRIDPSGVLWEYTFDRNGNTIEIRRKLPSDERARVMTVATYDERGNQVESVDFPGICIGGSNIESECNVDADCPSSSCGVRQSNTYDIYGNLRSTTDHVGYTTTYEYDAHQNRVSMTDPLGNVIRKTYTSLGQVELATNARGYSNLATYDQPFREPTRIEHPLDADHDGQFDFVEYAYNELGHQVASTDPNGNTTTFVYDDTGRVLSQTDALGNTTEHSYDSAGRPLSTRSANGAVSSFVYTETGKLSQEIDPLGNATTYAYDSEDRLVSVTDPLGRQIKYDYDSAGRLIFVEGCGAGETDCLDVRAEFDEVGNLARLIDPRGYSTWFEHDLAGRVMRETNELGHSTRYAYDGRGLLTSFANARGQTITFDHDAAGRQTAVNVGGSSIVHTLDANGNAIASTSDRFPSAARVFDPMDRLVERTDEFGNTVRYVYDPAGNLRALTYSDGSKVVYSYDALNRLVRLEDWYDPASPPPDPVPPDLCEASASCRLTTYAYDAVGNPTTVHLPDGTTVTQGFDLARRLTSISVHNPVAGTIFATSHTINASGLLTASGVTLPLDPQIITGSETLVYNELNQVTSRGADLFSYDEDGNLISGVLDGVPVAMTYDELNQLEQINGDTFEYDVDGLRVEATRAGETRRYVFDTLAGSSQLLEEHDANGNVVARYVYGLGLISREDGGGQDYRVYHFDTRGSTVALTDATGAITDAYAYDPYGASAGYEDRSVADPPTPNPFRYNGRSGVIDDGNGLYYMGARYYAPELMRFVQQDVAPTGLSDTQSINRYAYVKGNPIQFVDSDGNWFGIDDLISIVVGAVVGAVSQGIECAISGGDACGWEEFVSSTVSGAAAGGLALYIGPVAAGAIGGALDGALTWGLKAIPGGADAGSWQENLWNIGEGSLLGGALGKGGGGGLSRKLGAKLPGKFGKAFAPSQTGSHLSKLRKGFKWLSPRQSVKDTFAKMGTKATLFAREGAKSEVLWGIAGDAASGLAGIGGGHVMGMTQAKDYYLEAWGLQSN